jgi:uncharacterized protein with ParB-like and HNH nuclease domain
VTITFLGSAVIIKKPTDRNAQVVDGQQRLTTLTILLSCLRYKIDDIRNKETISTLIFQKGDELLGTAATFRLKTRSRDQQFFNALVQEKDGLCIYFNNRDKISFDNDAQRQMSKNVKALIERFVEKQYSKEQLKHLTGQVRTPPYMI